MLGLPVGSEWLIILLVIVIFFGGKKIPELMRGLGSGVREFKKASSVDTTDETKDKKREDA